MENGFELLLEAQEKHFYNTINSEFEEFSIFRLSSIPSLIIKDASFIRNMKVIDTFTERSVYKRKVHKICNYCSMAFSLFKNKLKSFEEEEVERLKQIFHDYQYVLRSRLISEFDVIKEMSLFSISDNILKEALSLSRIESSHKQSDELIDLYINIYKYSLVAIYLLDQDILNARNILGKIIVIEGIDGSGKKTQAKFLHNYLLSKGINCKRIHFPSYNETFFGKEVANYLNGKYGENVNPKLASLLFAGDRYEKREFLCTEKDLGTVLVLDRFVYSNVAHHVHMLPIDEQLDFERWLEELEFSVYKLPKPDLIIFLDVLPKFAKILINKKGERNYTEKKEDLYEESMEHLEASYNYYIDLSHRKNWIRIECNNETFVKNEDEVSREIINSIHDIFDFQY